MFKRILVTTIAFSSVLLGSTSFASVGITFNEGQLYNSNGTTAMADGKLLQVIAAGADGNFSTPTNGSFFSGDDVLLTSFQMDSGLGGAPGATSFLYTFDINSPLFAGEKLILRWWPTLNNGTASPASGNTYGEFRTDTVNFDGSPSAAWVIPASGNVELDLFTASYAGAGYEPASTTTASHTVAPVPEPSSIVLSALGLLGVAGFRRLRRK